jgi:hypothetical protein
VVQAVDFVSTIGARKSEVKVFAICGAVATVHYLSRRLPNRLWLIVMVPMLGIGLATTGSILGQIVVEATGDLARTQDEIVASTVVNTVWAIILAALTVPLSLWSQRRRSA